MKLQEVIDRLIPYLNPSSNILDIGCGKHAEEIFNKYRSAVSTVRYTGIDSCFKNSLNTDNFVIETDLNYLDSCKEMFDVLVLSKVLHIRACSTILTSACDLLIKGGIIFIQSTENISSVDWPDDKREQFISQNLEDNRYKLENNGFEIVSITKDDKFWQILATKV